jgi:erythromycin esterase-like protein
MRRWNETRPMDDRMELRGLDVYSLHRSRDEVLAYLDRVDPQEAAAARRRYSCLTPYLERPRPMGPMRGRRAAVSRTPSLNNWGRCSSSGWLTAPMTATPFSTRNRNARVVSAAEGYYRAMYRGATESWNLRDSHMFETLTRVLEQRGSDAKAIVWAHNSHIGNAGATAMGEQGEFNIGQLCHAKYRDQTALIGFSTSRGHVLAADEWGGKPRIKAALLHGCAEFPLAK